MRPSRSQRFDVNTHEYVNAASQRNSVNAGNSINAGNSTWMQRVDATVSTLATASTRQRQRSCGRSNWCKVRDRRA